MDRLQARALAYAERYARGWCQDFDVPEHARDDAIQEARIEALKRARTYNEDKGQMLEEWVRAQMEPRLFRWLRRLHQGGITGTSEAQSPVGVFNATIEEPQDIEPADDAERLLSAIDALAPEETELLVKYYGLDGVRRTQAQLAMEHQVTQQAVAKRISRVLEKIHAAAVVKNDIGGNPYRGDEAQTESPGIGDSAALGGGATIPSYASTEYKHLKKQFQDMCECAGYPSSAAPNKHGLHDEQTGPGTLSTKCSEWISDGKFWTPERKRLRKDAATRFAEAHRTFRDINAVQEEQLQVTYDEAMEGWDERIPARAAGLLLRHAQQSPRYSGVLVAAAEDKGDEE